MQIMLNGENYTLNDRTTIHDLLLKMNLATPAFAVAVNRKVVPKSSYNQHWLQDNDSVEIVVAYQGG